MVMVVLAATPASAHASFVSSDPADGAVLEAPVAEVRLTFSDQVEPSGAGFEGFDAGGTIRAPSMVRRDGTSWVLSFELALTGDVGVRFEVKAPDAHPFTGAFSFTAGAPPGSTTTTTTTTAASSTTAVPEPSASSLPQSTEPAPATTTAPSTQDSAPALTLEEFLEGREVRPAGGVGSLGRALGIPAALLIVGSLSFAAWVLRSDGWADPLTARWAWRAAWVLVVAVPLEIVAVGIDAGSLSQFQDDLTSRAGAALALRLVGALVLVWGAGARWRLEATAAVAVSFAFDGHTVSEGVWVVMAAADIVHVVAAGSWFAGLLLLGIMLRDERSEAERLTLVGRFSTLAGWSLGAATIAGVAMTVVIGRGFDAITSTWGVLLICKVALVAAAAALGAYNRWGNPRRMAQVVFAEFGLLLAASVVTAFLVAASAVS